MRSHATCIAALFALFVGATSSHAQISYVDFSSVAGLALNGSAGQSGNVLQLTPALNSQGGTAWYQTPVSVAAGFSASFAFRISPPGGADGMTFIIQNDVAGTAAIGTIGGPLCYDTMTNLLAIEIDNYTNGNFGDPNNNHISVHLVPTTGPALPGPDENLSIAQATPPFTLADGNVHTVCVEYVPGTLTVTLDNAAAPLISVPFDFVTGATTINGQALGGLNLISNTDAYVGFTGSTGGLNQANDILSFSFGPPGCPPIVGPWQTNNAQSSLDLNGQQGSAYSPAVTTDCVGATVTMNSSAPAGELSDIGITFAAAVAAALTTPGGQQVNLDITDPSFSSFNGGAPNFGGLLNLQPHPGSFSFPVPTGTIFSGSAQQVVADATHPDGFQLSQAVQLNISAGGASLPLSLGDDATTQVILSAQPLCATAGVMFYGTSYSDMYVNSNGDVSFTVGHTDFTATYGEWQSNMPRMGIQTDLQPNVYGTITVTNNGSGGLGDWITTAFTNVTEWGTTGMGVTSYNVEFHGPNGHEISGFTTDGTWGATAVVGGISLGAGGTHPGLVSFDAANGAGLTPNVNATDSVVDENTGGMLLNTTGWTSIAFPLFDGSAYIVQ